jgi:hypothetical protein
MICLSPADVALLAVAYVLGSILSRLLTPAARQLLYAVRLELQVRRIRRQHRREAR